VTGGEAGPAASVRPAAGEPFSVIVRAVPKPNAPELCCWQLGQVPLPSVHCDEAVHALKVDWSQVPAVAPEQQRNGLPGPMHELLCGHDACAAGAPSKQSVPAASMSRQKPQNTPGWAVQGPVLGAVQQLNGVPFPVHWLFGAAIV